LRDDLFRRASDHFFPKQRGLGVQTWFFGDLFIYIEIQRAAAQVFGHLGKQ
jgi:hypothetical protein